MSRKKAKKARALLEDLTDKKDLIINAVRLGMTWRDAALSCAIPDAEILRLEKDPEFLREISITEKILEKDLLQMHDQAVLTAMEKGNAAPIQWRLSCINPVRWGGKTNDGGPADLDLNLVIRKVRIGNAN